MCGDKSSGRSKAWKCFPGMNQDHFTPVLPRVSGWIAPASP
jgi:hypothetical protein